MQFQDYLAYAFILTFGVLHGSNDINILLRLNEQRINSKKWILRYLGAILAVLAVFMFSKLLALLFFLLISGYHFGEQHFKSNYKGPKVLGYLLYSCYGLSILFLIFFLKSAEVAPIFFDVTNVSFEVSFFEYLFYSLIIILPLLVGLTAFLGYLKTNIIKELFLFAVFFIVFKTASLLWAFGIYFIVWHSLPSMYDQMVFMYGNSSKKSSLKYFKSSWPYWILSLAGLGILYFLIGQEKDYFITIVLYVLAAITFPHVLVMSKIEGPKSSP